MHDWNTVFLIIFLTINYPPCQLSLCVETWRTRRKPTIFGRVLTNFPHVRSYVRYRAGTHDLSGGRTSLRRLSHRNPETNKHQLSVYILTVHHLNFLRIRIHRMAATGGATAPSLFCKIYSHIYVIIIFVYLMC